MQEEISFTESLDALEHIRAGVFTGQELLSKELLDVTFQEMDKEIHLALGYLLDSPSKFVERRLSDLAIRALGNLTYGRVLYNKDRFLENGKPSERVWMVLCGDLLNKLSARKTIENTKKLRAHLDSMAWVRAIYEEIIEEFLRVVGDYNDLSIREAKLTTSSKGVFGVKISKIRAQKILIEEDTGLDSTRLYGVINGVLYHRNRYMDHRNTIINPFLRLVFSEASKIAGPSKSVLTADIFQAGVFGLMRAISTFFLEKQTYFSGYARWWVRQSILLSLKEEVSFFRIPSAVWNVYNKIARGEDVDGEPERIRQYVDVTRLVPIDQPITGDMGMGTTMLSDTLVDRDQEDAQNEREVNSSVVSMLSDLEPTAEKYICLKYGMIGHLPGKAKITEDDILREKVRQTLALRLFRPKLP